MRALVATGLLAAKHKLVGCLRSGTCHVECVDTGEDVLELARRYDFDVVVVGLDLPDMTGTELIRRMRRSSLHVAILALSPTPHVAPRVAALAAGADDIVTLPLDEAELSARLRALVRRSHGHSHQVLSAGPVSVNLESYQVAVNGRAVRLTMKEAAVLELLILRCNTAVTKETFLNQLYADADQEPDPKIIDVFVCKVRKKLADAGAPNLIETVWGRGYMVRTPQQEQKPGPGPLGVMASTGPVYEIS